jgi:hypothetical protein
MLRASKAEKIHISNIVVAINRKEHDYVLYDKHKRTMDEIEGELGSWRVILSEDGNPVAFIKVHSINWISRVLKYSIIFSTDADRRMIIRRVLSDLFDTYNCNKLTADIIYDRSEAIKDHIFLGGNIEVRKRQHYYLDGKYVHVVEMSIFQNEFKNE